jgi:hypothetical protein
MCVSPGSDDLLQIFIEAKLGQNPQDGGRSRPRCRYRSRSKRTIFLIVDRGPAHRAKKRKPSSKLWAENYGFIFCLRIRRIAIQMSWSGSI